MAFLVSVCCLERDFAKTRSDAEMSKKIIQDPFTDHEARTNPTRRDIGG